MYATIREDSLFLLLWTYSRSFKYSPTRPSTTLLVPVADRIENGPDGGLGNGDGVGICHSYAPDGRCISLLKILLTNYCVYDCAYCINRVSSDTPRARFTPQEVVNLTIEFYRRNYIEGLFLSSGVIQNIDYTMEELIQVARTLRVDHRFGGYIHLKAVPGASRELMLEAGKWADRLSANVELPTQADLNKLAPAKSHVEIETSMSQIRDGILEAKDTKQNYASGQSTQMVVGATDASDAAILATSSRLYSKYNLRRVYYSGFSPIPFSDGRLPPIARRLFASIVCIRQIGWSDFTDSMLQNLPNLSNRIYLWIRIPNCSGRSATGIASLWM